MLSRVTGFTGLLALDLLFILIPFNPGLVSIIKHSLTFIPIWVAS